MSLDVYVMPLGKYWAGEYTTAAERLAEAQGLPYHRVGNEKAIAPRDEAYQLAQGVRVWMDRKFLTQNSWDDDGEIVFAEQFHFPALHALRAYAAHHQWGEGEFDLQADFHKSPLLQKLRAGVPTDFPHLVHHEDNQGFYVPLDFKHPTKLMGQPPTVGSSVQLMFELATLRASLDPIPTYEEWQAGTPIEAAHPGLEWAKYGVLFLYQVSWLSVQNRLPIIFDG